MAAVAAVTVPLANGIVSTARGVELPPVVVPSISPTPSAPVATAKRRTIPSPQAPSSALTRWLEEDVVYIITEAERLAYQSLRTDEERQAFIEQFWLRRDPTPGTAANEFKDEHYRRIVYANRMFPFGGTPGWKTDRGHVLIVWGRPDELESHPNGGIYRSGASAQTFNFPYEVWLYRYIEGTGSNVLVEFVDPSLTGNFVKAEPR
jgi:GWxTD domain-containing protein